LISIQNLVSLCWDGFVSAAGGYVRPDLVDPEEVSNAKFWCDRLMEVPVGTQPPDPTSRSRFFVTRPLAALTASDDGCGLVELVDSQTTGFEPVAVAAAALLR